MKAGDRAGALRFPYWFGRFSMFVDKRQLAVFVAGFCAFTNLYPVQALLPELMRAFDADAAAVGLAVAVSTLAVALVAPFMGAVSDALGRKPVMAGSLAILGVLTMLPAFAESLRTLVLLRFLAGLFVPGIFTVLVAYIREEWDPRGAVETTTFYISGSVLGGFGGRFIAGWAAEHWGWEAAFAALGMLDLLLLPALIFWLPASRNFQPGSGLVDSVRTMRRHLGNRRLLTAFSIGFGMLFGLVGTFSFVSLYLAQPPFSLGVGAIGSIFAVYLLGVVVTPVAGKLIPRFGRSPIAVLSLLVGIAGLLLTLLPNLAAVAIGLALFSTAMFVVQGICTGYVPQAAVGGTSAAVGLYVCCYYIGGTLGAVVPGPLWHAFGWPGCVALMAAVQAAMAVISHRLWSGEAIPAGQPARG